MAGYSLSSNLKGATELEEAFRQAPKIVRQYFADAIMKIAHHVESRAKGYVPLRFGALKNSIHTEGPQYSPSNVQAIVGTDLEYAIYQEKGTGIYAGKGRIVPKRARFLAWKKGGKWIFAKSVSGTTGKFYMLKAKKDSQAVFDLNIGNAFDAVMSHLAKG
mgnify:CR=1 FL=1